MNRDLFLAILAMDSYNRGYGAGVSGLSESGKIGTENLAVSFGTRTKLKQIVVEIANNDVTTGIEKRLRGLNRLDQFRRNRTNSFSRKLPDEVRFERRAA